MAPPFSLTSLTVLAVVASHAVNAHIVPWVEGMYCQKGPSNEDNQNTNDAVNPLYQLSRADWWMHAVNDCDKYPPAEGVFLELPANGEFTVEMAMNRAFTTLSYNGDNVSDWPNGEDYPEDYSDPNCITSPNLHTHDQADAAGSAFAISYNSDLAAVTDENLVVFTVLEHTPWKRLATFQVPDLPACPEGGCTCAWGWVPNGCGEPNMYMFPYKCTVTGATSTKTLAPAKPAVWCENDEANCTSGAKQMIFWHQLEGNNIEVEGQDAAGDNKSPAYNEKLGFKTGPQTDIFA